MTRTGALSPYIGDARVYLCPGRLRFVGPGPQEDAGLDLLSTSCIVPSMNAFYAGESASALNQQIKATHKIGRTVPYVTKTSELTEPGPSFRMVFVDEGSGDWDTWIAQWGTVASEPLPVHHSDGTCLSFADGHVEHWKWIDPETVASGRLEKECTERGIAAPALNRSSIGATDFVRLHQTIWGRGP